LVSRRTILNMTNTASYAQRELGILVKSSTDPENRPLFEPFIPEILALCEKFGLSGQSGGSAPSTAIAISQAIKKLCLQEPICPITGIADEWMNVTERMPDKKGELWQNTRCSSVFRNGEGNVYYLDAIVWKTQTGGTWSGSAFLKDGPVLYPYTSRQFVKSFPFTPKTFYIDVTEMEVAKDDWEFYINDKEQLDKVFKYYDKYDL
jgi:hypothetical protein